MSFRGHVRKVNKIEYGASSCSDYLFLQELIEYYATEVENDNVLYIDNDNPYYWEIEEEEFEKLVNYFKSLSEEDIESLAKNFNKEKKEIDYAIEDFNDWLEDGKKAGTGWITIDWF